MRKTLPLLSLLFACVLCFDALGQTIWQPNGVPVCLHTATQSTPTLDAWQEGGGAIAWIDGRGADADVYFQYLLPDGTTQFPVHDGFPVCTATGDQLRPIVNSDGSDGTFVGWTDFRAVRQIYAQYINAAGAAELATNGIPTTTTLIDGGQDYATFVGSSLGEVIVLNWHFGRPFNCRCHVGCPWYQSAQGQKLTRSGQRLWGDPGSFYSIWGCTDESALQMRPIGIANSSEGAVAAWDRFCCANGTDSNNREIYAKVVASNGAGTPADVGLPISDLVGHQEDAQVTTNLAGGAIVAWEDHRTSSSDIYAQWVYASGDNVRWTIDGELIASSTGNLLNPKIAHDSAGGAWIAWEDHSNPSDANLYVQHITIFGDTTGTRIAICEATQDQGGLVLVEDGSGGVIAAWWDERNGFRDVYAQNVASDGTRQWPENGLAVCTASFDQDDVQISSDRQGGAVVVWRDERMGFSNPDIYAQRLNDAIVGVQDSVQEDRLMLNVAPNPMTRDLSIAAVLPTAAEAQVSVFSVVGGRVATIWQGPLAPGLHEWTWDGTDDSGKSVSSGTYFLVAEHGDVRGVRRLVTVR